MGFRDRTIMSTSQTLLLGKIFCWFGSSAVCTAGAKISLSLLNKQAGICALTLTSAQFAVAGSASALACILLGQRPPSALRELALVAVAYTCGFLLLNASLGRLPASFTETVRGLEPLSSFALAWIFNGRGSRLRRGAALSLLVLLIGAVICVLAQPRFDHRGLFLGLCANMAFSSRSLLVTKLQDAQRNYAESAEASSDIDGVGLFAAQHLMGMALLFPAAYALEGSQCVRALSESHHALHSALLSSFGFFLYNLISLYVLLELDAVAHSVCHPKLPPVRERACAPHGSQLWLMAPVALECLHRYATPVGVW